MSTTCNLIQQVKVSDLVRYNTLTAKDLILTIESEMRRLKSAVWAQP